MKNKPFPMEQLPDLPLEHLTDLWEAGVLSEATKDWVATQVPILKLVRQAEVAHNEKKPLVD